MDLKSTLKTLKLNETLISGALGIIVIIVLGIVAVNFFAKNEGGETIPSLEVEEETTLPTTHIVADNEDLWSISEKYYGTGYNWTDIAEANNLTNPNEITEGAVLSIPNVTPKIAEAIIEASPQPEITLIPTSVPKETFTGGELTHKVTKGEDLWKISEKYYQSSYNWVDIAYANNLENANRIEIDQELIIPEVEAKIETVTATELTESISGASYVVVADDNLWSIAVRAYGDGYKWSEIAKENNLENPGIIHPGNVLSIPR